MKINVFFLSLLILVMGNIAIAAASTSPTAQLRSTIDEILTVLRDGNLSVTSKQDRIRVLVRERFDFRAMAQRTLATNWKKASNEQKIRFVDLYTQFLENNYLGLVEEYTNERVEYGNESIKKAKYAKVNTLIITSTVNIPVNYKLRLKGKDWFIYDVDVEGVSMVNNYRSSFQQIVKKDGMAGLLAQLEEKVNCTNC